MARIPRQITRTPSSGRVPGATIPFDIANTGEAAVFQGLGDVGRGATDFALTMNAIKDKDDRNKDSLTLSENKKNSRNIVESYEIDRDVNPENQTREKAEEYWDSNSQFDDSKYNDENTANRARIEWDIKKESFLDQQELYGIGTRQNLAILESETLYMSEPTPENRIQLLGDFTTKYGEKEAAVRIQDADATATELQNKRAISSLENTADESVASAEAVIFQMESLLESRAGNKKDTSVLSNTDARDVISSANDIIKEKKAKAKADEAELIKQTTNETLSELNKGELTIVELDNRFDANTIERSEYKSMRKSLIQDIPDRSDDFVRSEISTTMSQLDAGQITKQTAQLAYMNAMPSLDESDRKKFGDALEAIPNKIIGNAMVNAKNAGRELISPRFRTPDGGILTDIEDLSGELSKQELEDEKRRLNLEIRLEGIYKDSLDEWKESQLGKDLRPSDVRSIENDLLIEYRKIKARELDAFEADIIAREQPVTVKQPIPESKSLKQLQAEKVKPISKMTTEEKRARLAEIRKLRK